MSVGLGSRRLVPLLNLERFLQENESRAQLIDLAVVTGQVVVGHGQAMLVVFGERFAFAEQSECVFFFAHADVLHGEHVADVADLDADFGELFFFWEKKGEEKLLSED